MRWVGLLLMMGCAHAPTPLAPRPPPVSDDARAWFARAALAQALGDTPERDRALAWMERLDLGVEAPLAAARLLAEAGDAAGALAAWRRAHDRDPSSPAVAAQAPAGP